MADRMANGLLSRKGYQREWRRLNPEKMKSYKERYRARVAKWEADRYEMRYARIQGWRKAHSDDVRSYTALARAKRRLAEGRHSAADIRRMYATQEGRCYYCRVVLNGVYEVEHKQPLARGGTNWPDNIACACPRCNRRKRVQTEAEFKEKLLKAG